MRKTTIQNLYLIIIIDIIYAQKDDFTEIKIKNYLIISKNSKSLFFQFFFYINCLISNKSENSKLAKCKKLFKSKSLLNVSSIDPVDFDVFVKPKHEEIIHYMKTIKLEYQILQIASQTRQKLKIIGTKQQLKASTKKKQTS